MERTFPFPEGVDADKIKASFKKGVFAVTLRKTAEARRAERKIAVKASLLFRATLRSRFILQPSARASTPGPNQTLTCCAKFRRLTNAFDETGGDLRIP